MLIYLAHQSGILRQLKEAHIYIFQKAAGISKLHLPVTVTAFGISKETMVFRTGDGYVEQTALLAHGEVVPIGHGQGQHRIVGTPVGEAASTMGAEHLRQDDVIRLAAFGAVNR